MCQNILIIKFLNQFEIIDFNTSKNLYLRSKLLHKCTSYTDRRSSRTEIWVEAP